MLFERQQYDEAATELKKLADNKDNDELLYLMDLGTVYHVAGKYSDAIAIFEKAEKLAGFIDYTSISGEAGSVLLSEDVKPYKGEDFENLLVTVYLAIDYTMMHRWEDALVECRRVNHKLDVLMAAGKFKYDHNNFAKYLSAALFESQREYNDAFVDYRQLQKWIGSYPYLPVPLLRLADILQDSQEYAEYQQKFPGTTNFRLGKDQGEIILLLEQGKAPIKVPRQDFRLAPRFVRRGYYSNFVWMRDEASGSRVRTYPLYDIEMTAIRELDSKMAGIVAKRLAGLAVKAAAGYGVAKATNNPLLGELTGIILAETDHADLRSWTTLPARLQIARVTVPAGRHNLVLDMVTNSGSEVRGVKRWDGIEVKPGERVFLNYRTLD